jgi:hypothetical protein
MRTRPIENGPPTNISAVRKLLTPFVASSSKLSGNQVLLKAAALRVITQDQFNHIQEKAKGKGANEIKAVQWPDQSEEQTLVTKPKRKRPDVAARKKNAKDVRQDVVTWTWRQLCKEPALALPIGPVLSAVNQMTCEAYELANFHVLRMLRNKKQLGFLDQTFFQRCCYAVCYEGKWRYELEDDDLDESARVFDSWRPADYKPVDAKDMRSIIQTMGLSMATAASNLVKTNFYRRCYQYIKKTLDCKAGYARNICALVWGDRRKEPSLDPFVLRMREKMPECPLRSTTIQHFMPLLNVFQRHVEGRKHSLLPHKASFTTPFLTINANVLRKLIQLAGVKDVPSEGDFLKQQDAWWGKLFKVNKLETKNRWFGHQIMTDGKSVKVLMLRERHTPKHVVHVDMGVDQDGLVHLTIHPYQLNPSDVLDKSLLRVVRSVDPGLRKIATSAGVRLNPGSPSTMLPTKSVSAGEFYHDAHYKSSTRRMQRWTQSAPGVAAANLELANKHYDTFQGCKLRMLSIWQHMEVLFAHYGAMRFRNQKLLRHIGMKRKLHAMCLDLVEGLPPDNVCIGYGDFSRGTGMKGAPPGPYRKLEKELKKHAHVLSIPEWGSSKTCSQCHERSLHNMVTCVHKEDGSCGKTKVHGVLHCSTSDCLGKTWDRDVNAALNILLLTMSALNGWAWRPTAMKPHAPQMCVRVC